MSLPRPLVAVVAMARNGVIGQGNAMPWHIPSDLKHYRAATMNKPMIMGRRTLLSIGRVLDGRDTIVLTRSGATPIEGALVADNAEAALALAARCADARGADEIVIAGGAEIYRLFWPDITRLDTTLIEADPEGDTWFPAISPTDWILLSDTPGVAGPRDSAPTRRRVYERR